MFFILFSFVFVLFLWIIRLFSVIIIYGLYDFVLLLIVFYLFGKLYLRLCLYFVHFDVVLCSYLFVGDWVFVRFLLYM